MANNRGHSQDTQNKHYSKEQADIMILRYLIKFMNITNLSLAI